MSKNYEKLYSILEEGFDIHHIDWNHNNDNVDNLITIPRKIHELIHEYLGYVTRDEINLLVKEFQSTPNYRKRKISYLNFKLSKYVNMNKDSDLANSCMSRLGEIKKPKKRVINHKTLYEKTYGKIREDWDVHHIDWNHENNDINNLIAIPKKIHYLVHKYLGYVTRDEFEKLLETYQISKFPSGASLGYLNYHLHHLVDTNKKCELGVRCRVTMQHNITIYQNRLDWRDGKGGMA